MKHRMTPAWAQEQLARAGGQRFVTAFRLGHLEIEYYKPLHTDPQQPHTRDEIYFVISGTGTFVQGRQRRRFGPGEVLFVPAGQVHRFEDFSADFATWAVFTDIPVGGPPGATPRP
jgi:mannose-6-phosphate isomerase-like protein (cupin superfamily)